MVLVTVENNASSKGLFIPPLFESNKFIINFTEESDVFNSFFAKQCFPNIMKEHCPNKESLCRLSFYFFSIHDIRKLIRNLDFKKPHGYYMISILNAELCDTIVCKPLKKYLKTF